MFYNKKFQNSKQKISLIKLPVHRHTTNTTRLKLSNNIKVLFIFVWRSGKSDHLSQIQYFNRNMVSKSPFCYRLRHIFHFFIKFLYLKKNIGTINLALNRHKAYYIDKRKKKFRSLSCKPIWTNVYLVKERVCSRSNTLCSVCLLSCSNDQSNVIVEFYWYSVENPRSVLCCAKILDFPFVLHNLATITKLSTGHMRHFPRWVNIFFCEFLNNIFSFRTCDQVFQEFHTFVWQKHHNMN